MNKLTPIQRYMLWLNKKYRNLELLDNLITLGIQLFLALIAINLIFYYMRYLANG